VGEKKQKKLKNGHP